MNELNMNMGNPQYKYQLSQMENQLGQLKNAYVNPKDVDRKKLKESAQQFEAIFFKQLVDQMDKTVERNDFLSGGQGEEMFRSMMYDEISKKMATRPGGSGLGLAELIYKQTEAQLSDKPAYRPPDPSGLKIGKQDVATPQGGAE